jgi:hypothetical protein
MSLNMKLSRVLVIALSMTLFTGLVAFLSAPVVSADTILRADWIDLDYDPATMLGEAIYNVDAIDATFFCLGEGDGINDDTASTCTIQMQVNIRDDDVDGLLLNISQYSEAAFDFNDLDTSTDQIEGNYVGGNIHPATNPMDGDWMIYQFQFDVLATSTLGTPGSRDLTIRYWYWDENALQERSDTLSGVKIYIASIFDNPANDPDGQLANAMDGNEDGPFEAGDMFEATTITLTNYEPLGGSDITDLEATVTEPGNGVTLSGGRNVCSIPNGIASAVNVPPITQQTANLLFRTDVAVGTPPGVYSATADIVYTRADSDLTVTEDNLGVDWQVDFSFADDDPFEAGKPYSEYQCVATEVTITDADVGDENVTRSDESLDISPTQTEEESADTGASTLALPNDESNESQHNMVWFLAPVGIAVVLLVIVSALLFKRSKD